jgi:RNA polymerase primary sigma factor
MVDEYLKEVARYVLLTPSEELELAKRAKEGDAVARERLIESNLRLVVSIARRYRSATLDLLDLVQEGTVGLVHAIDRYDWRRGAKLSTYAFPWIKHAILDAIATRRRRDELLTSLDARLDEEGELRYADVVADENAPDPLQSMIDLIPEIDLESRLTRLSVRSRQVIELRYGLRDGVARTADRVAADLGLARERVRTIELHSLRKLAAPAMAHSV